MQALLLFAALAAPAPPTSPVEQIRTVSSQNFIVRAPSRADSKAVLARAEELRRDLATFWLDEELVAGDGPAIISVKYRDDLDRGLMFPIDSKSRTHHYVMLDTSRELALGSTLAHELTHVVLATRFGDSLPAWANEGAASMQDDSERMAIRRRIVARFAQSGAWPDLRAVLEAKNITPDDQESYAVAASLTEYLLAHAGRAELLRFAVAGKQEGYDQALRDHYGIEGVKVLAEQWRNWAGLNARISKASPKSANRR
jgi:hypothetical protein